MADMADERRQTVAAMAHAVPHGAIVWVGSAHEIALHR
jgi:hypothetical protein